MSIFDEWTDDDYIDAMKELDTNPTISIKKIWELEFLDSILKKRQKYDKIYLTPKQRRKCRELLRKYDDYE